MLRAIENYLHIAKLSNLTGIKYTFKIDVLKCIFPVPKSVKQMTVLIIDDEAPAIKVLTAFVNKVPFLQLELATTNAFEGLELKK